MSKHIARPKVTLKSDGTVVVNGVAAQWSGLAIAQGVSVYFSVPMQRLVLRPDQGGVPLHRCTGTSGVFALKAAEFLKELGWLPLTSATYEARCHPGMLIADFLKYPQPRVSGTGKLRSEKRMQKRQGERENG